MAKEYKNRNDLCVKNKLFLVAIGNGQWATFARQWWIFDAKWQCPFTCAPTLIKYLHGKHKPIYHPTSDVGDHVVVINTRDVAMEGELWRTFQHFHHTGYPGGFSATRAYKVHDKDPTRVLRRAIYDHQKGNLQRRLVMERLHLYPDEDVPDDILANVSGQIRQVTPQPKRLDQYSGEQRTDFPSLFDWPEDHIINPGNKKL